MQNAEVLFGSVSVAGYSIVVSNVSLARKGTFQSG